MVNRVKASGYVPERLNKLQSPTAPADHLVTVVLLGKKPERGLDDSTTQTKHLRIQIICALSPSEARLIDIDNSVKESVLHKL